MRMTVYLQRGLLIAALACPAQPATAVTISIDYRFDSSGFFGAGNPDGPAAGQQAKASLEAAADFFSNILTDSLLPIQTPAPFQSSLPGGGTVIWQWTAKFINPSTGSLELLNDEPIAADEYLIFAGARPLFGGEAGEGGAGDKSLSSSLDGDFSPDELTQIAQTSSDFANTVAMRGKSAGFVRWGGSVAVATNTPYPWHYDYTTPTEPDTIDFYSVALHEIAHTLGFGASNEWTNLIDVPTTTFVGPAAEAVYGGPVSLSPDLGHWQNGTASVVYGATNNQEAAMDPTLAVGTRKRLTLLDVAGLADLGWAIAPSLPPPLAGDYNSDGVVDAADYTVWRDTLGSTTDLRADGNGNGSIDAGDYDTWVAKFGNVYSGSPGAAAAVPEPATIALLLAGSLALVPIGRRAGWR
jgi:hypothetical protein